MRLSAFSRVQFPSPSKLTGLRFPAVDSFLPLLPLPERSWATFVVNLFTVVRHSSEAFHDVCKRPLSSQSTPGQNDEGIRKCQIFLSHQNCHISTFVILHKQRCGNIWLPKHQMTPQALLHFFGRNAIFTEWSSLYTRRPQTDLHSENVRLHVHFLACTC